MALPFLCSSVFAQTIQNSVIGSAGASAAAGGVQMDYTVGEIVVETFTAGGNTLTQGFHQTNLTLVAIENLELFADVVLYPNPTIDQVQLDIPEAYGLMDVLLYDVTGKLVVSLASVSGKQTLDMSSKAVGTYYMHLMQPNTGEFKTFKLIKTY